MSGKRCSGCGEVKGVEAFSRCKSKKDGLQPRCKTCVRRHYEENREEKREYNRRYREKNREVLLELCRRWRDENRAATAEYSRRYRAKNLEEVHGYVNRYKNRVNSLTRESASHDNEPWTPEEDAHILKSDEPVAAVAMDLGRTYNAVINRRAMLRKKAAA